MIKKIWDFIGDIRLTFWLLLAAAALFFVGMLYTSSDFSYFKAMNEIRIQDWLARELAARPGVNWWLPALFALLFLLGANACICTINRIRELAAVSKKKDYRFVLTLFPSIVHILFITVMIGHAVTITTGSWTRIPLSEGAEVVIDPSIPPVSVTRMRDEFFPENSLLSKRIRQTEVTLSEKNGKDIQISYLDSIRYHGYRLHLDMMKQKPGSIHQERHVQTVDDKETCNKSETYRSRERKRDKAQTVFLLAIFDPGLPVILTAFTLILVIMTWYFVEVLRKRNNA